MFLILTSISHYILLGFFFSLSPYRLWATDHHQPLRIFAGHLSDVTCTRFHPNSNYLATGSADRTVRLWDVLNGNCVRILTGHKVRRRKDQGGDLEITAM